MLPAELLEKPVYKYFQDICNIPHGSYNEKEISDYLVAFAKDHGLEYYQDDIYNVIIIRPASAGRESDDPVILQGHMDMVCEKESGVEFDFEKDPLDIIVDGDFITANGTTLGGDDGIAVAMALAVLADDTLEVPRIEFICTVSEEVGMEGASGIDLSPIQGRKMINIDTEEEGHFLAGCAGGGMSYVEREFKKSKFEDIKRELVHKDFVEAEILVTNLIGGHSGIEIIKGGANANVLMGRIIEGMSELINKHGKEGFLLESISGGNKDNAIPRECKAKIILEKDNFSMFTTMVSSYEKIFRDEYKGIDDKLQVRISIGEEVDLSNYNKSLLISSQIKTLYHMILRIPNGIVAMSKDIDNMVETSLNLGVLTLEDNKLSMHYCVRSGIDEEYTKLVDSMEKTAIEYKASLKRIGEYPAWEYVVDSKFRDQACKVYEDMFGQAPEVETVHAGVECGILAQKLPGLEAFCIGPDLMAIHTPQEKMSISSADRTYDFLKALVTM